MNLHWNRQGMQSGLFALFALFALNACLYVNRLRRRLELQLRERWEDEVIGDYKISSQTSDHGHWVLCDGSMLNVVDYPLLFEVLGYRFGSSEDGLQFKLPTTDDAKAEFIKSAPNHGKGNLFIYADSK